MPSIEEIEDKNPQVINEYLKQVKKYLTMWKSFEISLIIVKHDDQWQLLSMRIILVEQEYSKRILDIILETPNLKMIKEIRQISDIDSLFSEIKRKNIVVGDLQIYIGGFRFDWGRSRKHSSILGIDFKWPIIWLRAYETQRDFELDENRIDKELNQRGYGSLYEESEENLGLHAGSGYAKSLQCVAPIFIQIQSASLIDDILEVSIIAHNSIKKEEINLVTPSKKGEKLLLEVDNISNEYIYYSCKENNIKGNSDSIIVRLFYGNEIEVIDEYRVLRTAQETAVKNPRSSILLSEIDEIKFREWLGLEGQIVLSKKGTQNKLEQYEIACMNLFSCAGFNVLNFGKGWDISGFDIIAISPDSNDIILISCVRSPQFHIKIEGLKAQYVLYQGRYPNHNIIPIICNPSPVKLLLLDNISLCLEERIILITPDEMSILYTMSMDKSHRDILEYLKGLLEQYIQMADDEFNY